MTQLREDNAHLQGRSAELLTSLRDLEVEVTEGRRDRDEARAELRNKIGPLEQKVKDLNEENTLLRSQLQELQSSKLIQLNQVNGKVNELEKALTKLVKSQ
jgi:chromosome segregation ATPase